MIMQQLKEIQRINNRVQSAVEDQEDEEDDDDSFSAPMIDASYLRADSQSHAQFT